MKVHHLNCATLRPPFGRLTFGPVDPCHRHMVAHCLLIETDRDGLVLVDSGFGTDDLKGPPSRLGRLFHRVTRPALDLEETALARIRAMGHQPDDLRHIILTHMDLDHAGGIADFPHAKVHVMRAEYAAAEHPRGLDAQRYRSAQWAHGPDWALYDDPRGAAWFGFDAVRDLEGLPPEILMVPLFGHSAGHCGIAVDTRDGWLLHAGDAYFHRGAVHPDEPPVSFGLGLFERVVQQNKKTRIANQARLAALATEHSDAVRVFCAHDAVEFERLHHVSD